MMTDNMKKFFEAASKNEALQAELKALADSKPKNAEAVKAAEIELAAKYGFTLTEDDFKPSEMAELTEDEMKAVAGGWNWTCECHNGGEGNGANHFSCDCLKEGAGLGFTIGVCTCTEGLGYGKSLW